MKKAINSLKSNLQIEMDSYHESEGKMFFLNHWRLTWRLDWWGGCSFIARLGYVAMVAGIVLGICTIKGYEILGRKVSRKGIVIPLFGW